MADTNPKPIYRIMGLHEADRPRERLALLSIPPLQALACPPPSVIASASSSVTSSGALSSDLS